MVEINLHVDYFEHIKTKRLISQLGHGAEVIPIRLWCYAAKFFQTDGIFKDMTGEEMLKVCEISSNKHACSILQALVKHKFLYKTPQGWYGIHDWQEYQGHIIAFKERARNAAQKRWADLKAKKELPPLTDEEIKKDWEIKE